MPLSYSCFISYRNVSANIARPFQEALENELIQMIELPVFRDEERLDVGDFYNQELAMALCRSACMVMLYIPRYFERENTYCAREFRAMEILEEQRLENLKEIGKVPSHGLIIPVIYRGRDIFPKYVSDKRSYIDFESYFLGGKTKRNEKYFQEIKRLAKYIYERCVEINGLTDDPCNCCDDFELPNKDETVTWLLDNKMLPPTPSFPGREV